ncbi:MAG: hypothetical protein LBH20_07955 [Treponema sp.]|jgi:hypothetical protein|nr:hypothetical protein [Treponema sp.]
MKKSVCLRVIPLIIVFGLLISACSDENQEGTKSFTMTQRNYVFPVTGAGYSRPLSVQVTNSGDTALTVTVALSGTNAAHFVISPATLNLSAGAVGSFTVIPEEDLEEGTYRATVTVSAAGLSSYTFNVSCSINNFHVYIAFGQSNMQGPGTAEAQDQTGVSERFKTLNVVIGTYAYGTGPNSGLRNKGEWYTAVPPNIIEGVNPTGMMGTKTGLSPMDYFGRTLVEKTKDHITIGVIAVANGDMALASFHKTRAEDYYRKEDTAPGRPSDTEMSGMNRYKNAGYANMYDAIIQNAQIAQNQGAVIKGIIVHQGESGIGFPADTITWRDLLTEIYDSLLDDLGLTPNSLPILLGQPFGGNGPQSVGNDGGENLGNALHENLRIQRYLRNAWIISSAGCANRGDNIHFSSAGIRELGKRYGEKMFELIYQQ